MLGLFDGLLCDVENGPLTGRATLHIRRRIHGHLFLGRTIPIKTASLSALRNEVVEEIEPAVKDVTADEEHRDVREQRREARRRSP